MIMLNKHRKILALLAEHGPMTGLGLIRASDGEFGRGTVYVWLTHLVDAGHVEKLEGRKYGIAEDGRRARAECDLDGSPDLCPA